MSSLKQLSHKKTRILFLGTQIATGGAQRVLLDQAGWFHERGYEVFAGFLYEKEPLLSSWKSENPFPIICFQILNREEKGLRKVFSFISGLWRLFSFLKKHKVGAIETLTHHANIIGIMIAWLAGVKIRLATHHGQIEKFPKYLTFIHTLIINSGIANSFACVSQKTRLAAIHEGIHPSRITVIPNGIKVVDVEEERINQLRSKLSLSKNSFLVLNAGRFTYQKAQTYLIQAIPTILKFHPETIFALAGDGVLRNDLENEVNQLNINKNVVFLGFQRNVREWMAACDVFILPSRSEGMPLVILEAMSMGKPVIATSVEGVNEIIQDGFNGILIAPEDPNELAAKTISILSNPRERKTMGESAKQRILQTYSLDRTCRLYQRILDPKTEMPPYSQ